jgi:nicotinamidase-related amidase
MQRALLLIDIQNDYFENGNMPLVGSFEASLNARKILDKFRKENKLIVHIQHIATRPNSTFFLPNTIGTEIHKNVKPIANEKVIIKHFPNSFRDTELLSFLKENKITNLVICGMMTHMCVDATVRAAKDYSFDIELISDACATRDLELNGQIVKAIDVQNSFLASLNPYYSSLKTTLEFLNEK